MNKKFTTFGRSKARSAVAVFVSLLLSSCLYMEAVEEELTEVEVGKAIDAVELSDEGNFSILAAKGFFDGNVNSFSLLDLAGDGVSHDHATRSVVGARVLTPEWTKGRRYTVSRGQYHSHTAVRGGHDNVHGHDPETHSGHGHADATATISESNRVKGGGMPSPGAGDSLLVVDVPVSTGERVWARRKYIGDDGLQHTMKTLALTKLMFVVDPVSMDTTVLIATIVPDYAYTRAGKYTVSAVHGIPTNQNFTGHVFYSGLDGEFQYGFVYKDGAAVQGIVRNPYRNTARHEGAQDCNDPTHGHGYHDEQGHYHEPHGAPQGFEPLRITIAEDVIYATRSANENCAEDECPMCKTIHKLNEPCQWYCNTCNIYHTIADASDECVLVGLPVIVGNERCGYCGCILATEDHEDTCPLSPNYNPWPGDEPKDPPKDPPDDPDLGNTGGGGGHTGGGTPSGPGGPSVPPKTKTPYRQFNIESNDPNFIQKIMDMLEWMLANCYLGNAVASYSVGGATLTISDTYPENPGHVMSYDHNTHTVYTRVLSEHGLFEENFHYSQRMEYAMQSAEDFFRHEILYEAEVKVAWFRYADRNGIDYDFSGEAWNKIIKYSNNPIPANYDGVLEGVRDMGYGDLYDSYINNRTPGYENLDQLERFEAMSNCD